MDVNGDRVILFDMAADDILAKCSPALRNALAAVGSSERREIQVIFRRDLDRSAREAALHRIEQASGAPAHVVFGIASVDATLGNAVQFAAFDAVEWVDLASTAAIAELLD